jgi:undecaprenyl-diphosphatase
MGWDAEFVLLLNRLVVSHNLGWLTHVLGVELTYLFPLAILVGWFSRDPARRRQAFLAGVAVVVAASLYYTISHVYFRHRPDVTVPGVEGFIARFGAFDEPAFPSGHATAAFAVVVALGWGNPGLLAGLLVVALLNALGRIAAGVHYPTDVLGGILLGTVASAVVLRFRTFVLRAEPWFARLSDRLAPFLPRPPETKNPGQ